MNKIIKTAFFVVAGLLLFSCDQNAERTIVDPNLVKDVVGFPQALCNYEVDASNPTAAFEVLATRASSEGDATYQLTYNNSSTMVVTVPASVTFKDGEAEAMIPITVTTALMEPGEIYTFTIQMPEAKPEDIVTVSREGEDVEIDLNEWMPENQITVNVSMEVEWTQVGIGTFTYNAYFEGVDDSIVLENIEGTNFYRIVDLFADGFPIEFILGSDGKTISVPQQDTGYAYDATDNIHVITHPQAAGPSEWVGNTLTFYFYYNVGNRGGFNINNPETLILR